MFLLFLKSQKAVNAVTKKEITVAHSQKKVLSQKNGPKDKPYIPL